MKLILTLISICTLHYNLNAQSKTIESAKRSIPIHVDVTFLTEGDRFYKPTSEETYHPKWISKEDYEAVYKYRISFVLSEIYYSLLIEKISLGIKEGEKRFICDSFFYTGFDVAEDILQYGRLTNLEFKEWIAYNRFHLLEGDLALQFEIMNDGSLIIEKI